SGDEAEHLVAAGDVYRTDFARTPCLQAQRASLGQLAGPHAARPDAGSPPRVLQADLAPEARCRTCDDHRLVMELDVHRTPYAFWPGRSTVARPAPAPASAQIVQHRELGLEVVQVRLDDQLAPGAARQQLVGAVGSPVAVHM